jgi:demethylmenaquinone methyltransferase/2-methoxy-6-polyprenyl-1,4-benzoquinol methylase
MDPERSSALGALRHTFGAESVGEEERRSRVRELFDRIAPRYDLMNDLMSFSLHRRWKSAAAHAVREHAYGNGDIVDLAGGTGDLALALAKILPGRRIVVADASAGMLEVARQRGGARFSVLQAEAERLPFADSSVVAVTLAFGLRNMADPAKALDEIARILAPGGILVVLEFSKTDAWFAPFYALQSRIVIPALGALVARDRGAYRYLVESIRIFPDAAAVCAEIENAGLAVIGVRKFMFGVAALHVARKAAAV